MRAYPTTIRRRAASTAAALLLAPLLLAPLLLTGCAGLEPVQPWEKGIMAKPEMGFEQDRLDAKYTEHVYSSKEGAAGGAGVGGGGCGCN
jgi:hypothetical protein